MTKERVLIRDLSHDGRGVAKLKDYTLFIPQTLPKEEVLISITNRKTHYGEGEPLEIFSPANERVTPPCPVFPLCGGCQLQHMEYQSQLDFKKKKVLMALKKIGQLDDPPPPLVHQTDPWYYRNKGRYHADKGKLGFYPLKKKEVVSHRKCFIQHQWAAPYKEELEEKGIISKIGCTLRTSSLSQEGMVILDKKPPINRLKGLSLRGIYLHHQKKHYHLYGEKNLPEKIGSTTFHLPPMVFFQVHDQGREILLKRTWNLLDPHREDILLDLYCGVGALSLPKHHRVKKIIGLDGDEEAIRVAREHAKRLDIPSSFSRHNLVGGFLKILQDKPSLALLDPPRTGCSKALLFDLLGSPIKRLLYISCDPATLARDLHILKKGFQVKALELVDMFPQTYHVECVVVLER